MADGVVVPFPGSASQATETLEAAREAHLAAFAAWLRAARPGRDDAAFEIEVFAATARQMAQRQPRT